MKPYTIPAMIALVAPSYAFTTFLSSTRAPSASAAFVGQSLSRNHPSPAVASETSSNHCLTLTATGSTSQTEPSSTTATKSTVEQSVSKLKRVLEREYTSFFDPMRTEYYSPKVTFDDPLTTLAGVQSYQNNVDMLAGRTVMGSFLFADAGINLHTITGGDVSDDGTQISDIITRWTLRVTAKILPWKPTARFSGISVYDVQPGGSEGAQITHQTDYWDSINIIPGSGGEYHPVDKSIAIQDFLNQLKPGGFEAKSAAPEIPYSLLRRGNGYEVRKYPAYTAVKLPYTRRDEGFGSLGSFTRGMKPRSPAIMEVQNSDTSDKYMLWPLTFAPPGQTDPPEPTAALEKAGDGQWRTMTVVTIPESVVAVSEFNDASMEPVVRRADRLLRDALQRDGLKPKEGSDYMVRFAQYDAIFSMGKRGGEVWIDLEEGKHPW